MSITIEAQSRTTNGNIVLAFRRFTLSGLQATREAVLDRVLGKFDVIHIATHLHYPAYVGASPRPADAL